MGRSGYHAYQGDEPYIFISYAHKDSISVLRMIEELISRKYRVWYDEGIEVGANWPEVIASRLANASHVIVFTSAASARSQNCTREINYAIDRKKQMSRVKLDETEFPDGLEMQLSVVPNVDGQGEADATMICDALEKLGCLTPTLVGDGVEGYASAAGKTKRHLNKWILTTVCFALLFVGAAGAALGLTRGWFSSAGFRMENVNYTDAETGEKKNFTYTVWNDPVSRDLLLSSMNSSSLYFCGNAFVSSADAIEYRNGAWRLGDTSVRQGDFTDLASIVKKGNITELSLVYQKLTGLSELSELPHVTYLDISGNEIQDLSPLKGLKELKILKIAHVPNADLSVLKGLTSLQKVYISVDMANEALPILHENFEVIVVE